jgi:hypothetical protein
MKRGPKLATKMYWKPTYTALKVQSPTSLKKGVGIRRISTVKLRA